MVEKHGKRPTGLPSDILHREKVRIKDPQHDWYNEVGYKWKCNVLGEVIIFYPISKSQGYVLVVDWDICEKVK